MNKHLRLPPKVKMSFKVRDKLWFDADNKTMLVNGFPKDTRSAIARRMRLINVEEHGDRLWDGILL